MEVITFLGPKIPLEVRKLIQVSPSLSDQVAAGFVKLVVNYLCGVEIEEQDFGKIAQVSKLDHQTAAVCFSGIQIILKSALRSKSKPDLLAKDMLELKLAQALITALVAVLKGSQLEHLEKAIFEKGLRYPVLTDFSWRVDVTISSNSLSRVLQPSVLMSTVTSDGQKRTFEVSVDKFHQLRYCVAKVLKEMEDLERMQILKSKQ